MAENDQPYSRPYESYTLENLNGGSYSKQGSANWQIVFAALQPTCPRCGANLSRDNFDAK